MSKVYEGKFDPEAATATVAWLVGHGDISNSKIYKKDAEDGIKIGAISDWLIAAKYTFMVDTCCYPNVRKRYQKFGKNYYCTNDGECVTVITEYPSFDAWWDASHMHEI